MSTEYRNNHYVPVWYQKRFIPVGQGDRELFYLDLKPGEFTDGRGEVRKRTGPHRWGPRRCFSARDLYTTFFGPGASTRIEQVFFGLIDRDGKAAVEYFSEFEHLSADGDAFSSMMTFMSTQKLRTPKGLGWLRSQAETSDRDVILQSMIRLRELHSAIWTECVWLVADATCSPTKFIVSDHPVTVYNRACGPRSDWCREFNDPDIRLNGTHTLFPLSLERLLVLANLSWVRNLWDHRMRIASNLHHGRLARNLP
jgi:hypothetical protein